jgi:O-methyltransferase
MVPRVTAQETLEMNSTERYLELLKGCLTRTLDGYGETYLPVLPHRGSWKHWAFEPVRRYLDHRDMQVIRRVPFNPTARAEGREWPAEAETMIGLARLDNLHQLIADVIGNRVPGDLAECGVWRGGATIFMRAVLEAYGDPDRLVWVADSFEGLPRPDPDRFPAERGDTHWRHQELAVGVDQVRRNFARYGLLDDRVRFLKGWFADTLPGAPITRLAVLRLDGDLYGSNIEVLEALYPKVSPGGYVVIDDYGNIPQCRQAVDDYREANGITAPLNRIDWAGVWWQVDGSAERPGSGEARVFTIEDAAVEDARA